MVDNSIGSQKNRLFFVSSRIADEHFSAIRNFIGEYPGGLIASDSVDTARALGRALQGRGEFEALVASDFQPGVDRDELYGVCDELYAELIRRYVRLVRDNPYIFQFEIEKFRSTFIDKFSSIISGLIHCNNRFQCGFEEVVFIGETSEISAFRKFDFDKARRKYAVPVRGGIARYRVFDIDAAIAALFGWVKSGAVQKARANLRLGMQLVQDRMAREQFSFRLFGLTFPPVRAYRPRHAPNVPRPPLLLAASAGGGPDDRREFARASFFQPLSELGGATAGLDDITLIYAESQSRPYAEGLAIVFENTPPERPVVVIAPGKSGGTNAVFNSAMLALAGQPETPVDGGQGARKTRARTGKRPADEVSGDSALPTVSLARRFPNARFFYLNYPEDYTQIDRNAVLAYYANDIDFVRREILSILATRFPPVLLLGIGAALESVIHHSFLHFYYAEEMARGVLETLSGRVSSVVTYSGRVAESRIAALEARRHGLKVVDWQCTILGKTKVFFPIIADRVLAICQNAVETYVSYFNVKRENCPLIGFPRFVRTMRGYRPERGRDVLAAAGIEPGQAFHIFAAQPLDLRYQKQVFDVLAEAVAKAGVRVLICSHPSQRASGETKFLRETIAGYKSKYLTYADDFIVHELFPLAKSTISYSSTFLFEVASVGFQAIILDPLEMAHVLDYTASDEVMWARDADQLVEKLRLAEKRAPVLDNLDFDAMEKSVCDALWTGFRG